jgi:hypothetical protein
MTAHCPQHLKFGAISPPISLRGSDLGADSACERRAESRILQYSQSLPHHRTLWDAPLPPRLGGEPIGRPCLLYKDDRFAPHGLNTALTDGIFGYCDLAPSKPLVLE